MARHGLCDASVQQIILLCESISPALGGAISQVGCFVKESFNVGITLSYLSRINGAYDDVIRFEECILHILLICSNWRNLFMTN